MEIIGAQHVAPQAPAFGKSLVEHVHGAYPDLIDRADVPAEMMVAGRLRAGKGNHVVIAAMDAVQERDIVARFVG